MNHLPAEMDVRQCRLRRAMRLVLLGLCLLVAPTLSQAADQAAPLRLTLSQAVALAVAENPDLSLAQYAQQAATVNVEAAQGRFFPSLQGSAGVQENLRAQAPLGTPDQYENASLQLTASLNLFNGYADQSGLNAAREQVKTADALLARQRQTLAFSVVRAFVSVLTTTELVRVAEQFYQSQQEVEKQIAAFHAAGVRAVTDLYQQQAETARAEASVFDARRNLQVAKLTLVQSLGRTPPQQIEALPPASDELDAALKNLDLQNLLAMALANRPDLIAQQRRIEAASLQIQTAQGGYLPSLDLQAGGGTSYNSANSGSFGGQLDDNRGASLGLQLTVPLFDRDQTRTNVAQARISMAETRASLNKLQQQVGLEVGQALADYQQARQQLPAVDRQLDYARQALEAGEARYQVGAATWVELSSARSVYVQAQADAVRARYALLLQGLNIGYSRGDLAALLGLLKENSS